MSILLKDLLNEAYFNIPRKVYQPVLNAFFAAYEKYRMEDVKRVTSKNFPEEEYTLDFSGTRFEFLDKLEPKPRIRVNYLSKNTGGGAYYIRDDLNILRNNSGTIYLNLGNALKQAVSTVEHEVSHFVQDLIRKVKYLKKKEYGYDVRFSDIEIGGVPSRRIMPGGVDTHGYKDGGARVRRVKHGHRPVEYYPDLLSAVRALESQYYEKIKNDPDYEKLKNSESSRKSFFVSDFLRSNNTRSLAVYVFNQFKEVSDVFYRKMLALAYDAFVNKRGDFDAADVYNKYMDIDSRVKTHHSEKRFEKSLKIRIQKIADEISGVSMGDNGFLDVDDESVSDILKIAGANVSAKTVTLPDSPEGIKKIFNTLARLRDEGRLFKFKIYKHNFSDKTGAYTGGSTETIPTPEQLKKIYSDIAMSLKYIYIGAAYRVYKPQLISLIRDSFTTPE